MTDPDARTKFLTLFSNLPLNIRKEIIVLLDDNAPISWNVAYLEVKGNTEKGKEILKKLAKLKII